MRVISDIKYNNLENSYVDSRTAMEEMLGIERPNRKDIKVNVLGINHFTWLTAAHYGNIDLMEVYRDFCEKYHETGRCDVIIQTSPSFSLPGR